MYLKLGTRQTENTLSTDHRVKAAHETDKDTDSGSSEQRARGGREGPGRKPKGNENQWKMAPMALIAS